MTTELHAAALDYAARGLRVLPLHSPRPDGGCDCTPASECKAGDNSRAKHPRTMHGLSDASSDPDVINRWWELWPNANVGVAIPPDMVAVDVDVSDVGSVLNGSHPLPTTSAVRTARGWHILYRSAVPIAPAVAVLDHVDLRGPGSYIVAPPSVHASGAVYQWRKGLDELADAPPWIGELARTKRTTSHQPGERIPPGSRNATLASQAGTMRRQAFSGEAIEAALLITNRDQCDPPLGDDEVRAIATSVARYEPNPDPIRSPDIAAQLPPEFWSERLYLATIRQAARSRQRSPDAVLGAVLARVAALVPHTLGLPATVGSEAGLGLLVAIVAGPGYGKTNANGISGELIAAPLFEVPSGSGEGLVESFFDYVEITDDKGKPKRERRQVRHNLLVYIDEGQRATRQAQQPSSTLFGTYRSAFTGGQLGDANATAERRRILPAGAYSIGIVAAFQPDALGPLFDDLAYGTPQRFLYVAGTDPTLPDDPPRWPGPLEFADLDLDSLRVPERQFAKRPHQVRLHISVEAEIRLADLMRQRGHDQADAWSAHRNLVRLKVAALLAILDGGRLMVTEADWRLAGTIVDVSDAVRSDAQRAIAATAAEREDETSTRYARRAVRVDELTEQRRVVHCIDAIVAKVLKEPGQLTRGKLRAGLSASQRDVFGEAVDKALDAGLIVERAEPGQGEDRVRLHPGRSP